MSDAELVAAARTILDELNAAELRARHWLFELQGNGGRSAPDLGDSTRTATFGATGTVVVAIDELVPGRAAVLAGRRGEISQGGSAAAILCHRYDATRCEGAVRRPLAARLPGRVR